MFDRKDAVLDLAGFLMLGAVVLVLAALALAGVPLAARALPFAVGAVSGDGLVCLAIYRNAWRGPAFLVTGGAVLVVISGLLPSSPGADAPWLLREPADLAWKLAFGFLLGFGTMVLSQVLELSPYAPASWEETVEQRRDLAHATFVVGGILLALVTVVAAVCGALALIAHAVGHLTV